MGSFTLEVPNSAVVDVLCLRSLPLGPDGDLVGARSNEERLKTASEPNLRPAMSVKYLDFQVVHPLVASKDIELRVRWYTAIVRSAASMQ